MPDSVPGTGNSSDGIGALTPLRRGAGEYWSTVFVNQWLIALEQVFYEQSVRSFNTWTVNILHLSNQ